MASQTILPVTEYDVIVGSGLVPAVRSKLGKLVFRRVHEIRPMHKVSYAMRTHDNYTPLCEYDAFHVPQEEWDQYGEESCPRFEGQTSPAALRENDARGGARIRFANGNFAVFDMFSLTFGKPAGTRLMPRVGDLVCGVLREGEESDPPTFSRWFVASEQFFRAWTLCMYWRHDSFRKALAKKNGATAFWMSGNRLMDGYLKYSLSACDHAEEAKRFWNKRTEQVSQKWLHILAALVFVVRYGVIPRDTVSALEPPQSKGAQTEYKGWHLPCDDWINNFAAYHGRWRIEPSGVDLEECQRPFLLLEKETLGKVPVYRGVGSGVICDPACIVSWLVVDKLGVQDKAASET